jgi:hypothetical protein
MAKRFFYVCLGVLALAVAGSIGFSSARAQIGGPLYFAGVGGASAAVVGRTLLVLTNSGPSPTPFPVPVPGTSAIVSVLVYNAGYMPPATTVVLANGDVYHWSGAVPAWALVGSYSGATPSRSTSWSELKSRYR